MKRATVQVPTGLHSQTVVTGWSNYWAADTPAWLGFISSRKRDSQITVYPHRGSQLGLDPAAAKRRRHTQWLWQCTVTWLRRSMEVYGCQPQLVSYSSFFHMYAVRASTRPSLPVIHTSSHHQSVRDDSIMQVCVRENRRDRWHQSTV